MIQLTSLNSIPPTVNQSYRISRYARFDQSFSATTTAIVVVCYTVVLIALRKTTKMVSERLSCGYDYSRILKFGFCYRIVQSQTRRDIRRLPALRVSNWWILIKMVRYGRIIKSPTSQTGYYPDNGSVMTMCSSCGPYSQHWKVRKDEMTIADDG